MIVVVEEEVVEFHGREEKERAGGEGENTTKRGFAGTVVPFCSDAVVIFDYYIFEPIEFTFFWSFILHGRKRKGKEKKNQNTPHLFTSHPNITRLRVAFIFVGCS